MKPLLLTLLLLAVLQAEQSGPAGSSRCQRCHVPEFRAWEADTARQDCESCHGPGKRHVLAPRKDNIIKPLQKNFRHGPVVPVKKSQPGPLRLDLFIMSHCPYGISAVNTLLPILERWSRDIDFHLYYIAHVRGDTLKPRAKADPDLPSEKCEGGNGTDGTDRFTSLHGEDEVLEGMRQVLIAERHPNRLRAYLKYRNRDINADWKAAAKAAGLPDSTLMLLAAPAASRLVDSLFSANIAEAEFRGVSGSPTLYVNGREYLEPVSAYPVERHFCQDAPRKGPCLSFPACAYDTDCRKKGFEGVCRNPMQKKAVCEYAPATAFTVYVVNDTACGLCHTGNLVARILERFPGARLVTLPLNSDSGRAWVKRYGLTTYPAFIFEAKAEKSKRFKEIRPTFRKAGNDFVLEERVVKSYHFIDRTQTPKSLLILGSAENPPVIEMVRDLALVMADSLPGVAVRFAPIAFKNSDSAASWLDSLDSPYGPMEVRAGINALCLQYRYPKVNILKYLVCRGDDIQSRFEEHLPEPADEWKRCARENGLDTAVVSACMDGSQGRVLFERAVALTDSLKISDPGPTLLLDNRFLISGYNAAIRRIVIRELKSTPAK